VSVLYSLSRAESALCIRPRQNAPAYVASAGTRAEKWLCRRIPERLFARSQAAFFGIGRLVIRNRLTPFRLLVNVNAYGGSPGGPPHIAASPQAFSYSSGMESSRAAKNLMDSNAKFFWRTTRSARCCPWFPSG